MEATLEALQAEKEVAAAQAEVEILEAAAEEGEYHRDSKNSSDTPLTVQELTNEYVGDQRKWVVVDSIPRSSSQNNTNLSSAIHDITQVNHSYNDDTTSHIVNDEQPKRSEVMKPAETKIPKIQSVQLPNTHTSLNDLLSRVSHLHLIRCSSSAFLFTYAAIQYTTSRSYPSSQHDGLR